MEETIQILIEQKLFDLKNGSAELHFDDEGLLQEIVFKRKRRKREGESLTIFGVQNGKSLANYDKNGIIQQITYETQWRRNRQEKV